MKNEACRESPDPRSAAPGTLLACFLALMQELDGVFSQTRTFLRARRLMLSCLLAVGRGWISRWLSGTGLGHVDWSAPYRLFSRAPWEPNRLFDPVIRNTLPMCDEKYVAIAIDETSLPRAGRRVRAAKWLRDPLSPKWRYNLKRSVSMIHAAVLPRSSTNDEPRCRAYPVRFTLREHAQKPRDTKKHPATAEELATYRKEQKRLNLSTQSLAVVHELRESYDRMGAHDKTLLFVVDGSFCNRIFFGGCPDRTIIVARARRDAVLCYPAKPGSRLVYDRATFTPEKILHDDNIPWISRDFYYGGVRRTLDYKEVADVLWQSSTKRTTLRLFVLRATGYLLSKNGKTQYRDAAFVLTTDLATSSEILIQAYLDRWQIEVAHRELKNTLGVGDAQVWADKAVPRQPAFVVAAYSLLHLAAHLAYGPNRTNDYEPLPKWRRPASRPSCLDLLTQLRKEVAAAPQPLPLLGNPIHYSALVQNAAG